MNKNQTPVGHVVNSKLIIDQKLADERKHTCPACNAKKHGVKSRVALKHTCGR